MQNIGNFIHLYRKHFHTNPITILWKLLVLTMRTATASKKTSFLFIERGIDAQDNAAVLFKYFRKNYPDLPAYYILDRNSSDWPDMKEYGNLIQYRSQDHAKLLIRAKAYISSMRTDGFFIAPFQEAVILLRWLPFFRKKKHVFLQHGITKDDLTQFHKKNYKACDLFICGAKPEFEYISRKFGYPKKEVQYTGFARFDNLKQNLSPKKQILLFPTWRSYVVIPSWRNNRRLNRTVFLQSEYYIKYSELLKSERLIRLLKEHEYRLVFVPHPEIKRYADLFLSKWPEIEIKLKNEQIQKSIIDAAMLVTDYSSIAFDFAFMHKPVLYYQFDKEVFYKMHAEKGYYNYKTDGFGPIAETKSELLQNLEECLDNHAKTKEKYLQKAKKFFPLKDSKNCERIAQAILDL